MDDGERSRLSGAQLAHLRDLVHTEGPRQRKEEAALTNEETERLLVGHSLWLYLWLLYLAILSERGERTATDLARINRDRRASLKFVRAFIGRWPTPDDLLAYIPGYRRHAIDIEPLRDAIADDIKRLSRPNPRRAAPTGSIGFSR